MKNIQELQELLDHINNCYVGDYASVSRDLYKAIYYFHYLEEGEIPRTELLNISFALYRLAEGFHDAHSERIKYEHTILERVITILEQISGQDENP